MKVEIDLRGCPQGVQIHARALQELMRQANPVMKQARKFAAQLEEMRLIFDGVVSQEEKKGVIDSYQAASFLGYRLHRLLIETKAGELQQENGFIFDEEPPQESVVVAKDFPLNGPGTGNEPPNICEGCQ